MDRRLSSTTRSPTTKTRMVCKWRELDPASDRPRRIPKPILFGSTWPRRRARMGAAWRRSSISPIVPPPTALEVGPVGAARLSSMAKPCHERTRSSSRAVTLNKTKFRSSTSATATDPGSRIAVLRRTPGTRTLRSWRRLKRLRSPWPETQPNRTSTRPIRRPKHMHSARRTAGSERGRAWCLRQSWRSLEPASRA